MRNPSWIRTVVGVTAASLTLSSMPFDSRAQDTDAQLQSVAASISEAPQEAFHLVDARPDSDKKMVNLSTNLFSCNFFVIAFGEVQAPSRVERLERDLKGALGERLNGHVITLHRYSIYINAQESMRGFSASVASGGIVGVTPASLRGSSCAREKMIGGWYESSELTNNFDPYVAEIEIELDGYPIKARAARSPAAPPGSCGGYERKKCYESSVVIEGLLGVQDKANQALIVELSARLPQA